MIHLEEYDVEKEEVLEVVVEEEEE